MKRVRLIGSPLLAIAVVVGGLAPFAAPAGAAGFGDVPPGSFYADAVDWLAEEEITTGTSPTTYSPGDPVTRGQMAVFLWRLMHEPSDRVVHSFNDVPPGAFYADAVAWLVAAGVTTGTSPTSFSPNDPVTRGQMAAFLWRLAGRPDAPIDHGFLDVADETYYAVPVAWLKAQGITTGTGATSYSPNAIVTRGQMAAFLHRLATDSDWERPAPPIVSDPGEWPEFPDAGPIGAFVPYTTAQFIAEGWNVNIPPEQDVHITRVGPNPATWTVTPGEGDCIVQDAGARGLIVDAFQEDERTFELYWEAQVDLRARLRIEHTGISHTAWASVIVDAERDIAVFRAEIDGYVYVGAVDCARFVG